MEASVDDNPRGGRFWKPIGQLEDSSSVRPWDVRRADAVGVRGGPTHQGGTMLVALNPDVAADSGPVTVRSINREAR